MGGRRAPRECKVQYARDYRAVTWEARNTRKDTFCYILTFCPLSLNSLRNEGCVTVSLECPLFLAKDKLRREATGLQRADLH